MTGLRFRGRHGVYPEERALGQTFVVSLTLYGDWRPAALADDLKQTADYAQVYTIVREIVEGPPRQLVETVAERIAEALLDACRQVECVRVRVEKPQAPLPGDFAAVGVELERSRGRGGHAE